MSLLLGLQSAVTPLGGLLCCGSLPDPKDCFGMQHGREGCSPACSQYSSLPAAGLKMHSVGGSHTLHSPCRDEQLRELRMLDDPDSSLPFIRQILSALRANVGGDAAVLGFIGTPWTLAAYAIEGASDRWGSWSVISPNMAFNPTQLLTLRISCSVPVAVATCVVP